MMKSTKSFLALLVAVFGCDAIESTEEIGAFVQPELDGDKAVNLGQAPRSAVLVEVNLTDGGKIKFIDEPHEDGATIGMMESMGEDSLSYVKLYRTRYAATPLEILEAVAPDVEIPDRFFEDHALWASTGIGVESEPRILPGPMDIKAQLQLTRSWTGGGACDDDDDFHDAFVLDHTGYSDHGHGHNLVGNQTAVTGVSNERAFGVCFTAGASPFSITATVEYEWTAGVWVFVDDETISTIDQSRYYTSSHGWLSYKYRVRTTNATNDTHHIEGSW